MTETVAAETVATRANKGTLAGVLANIDRVQVGDGEIVLASLITTYRGEEKVYSLMIQGEALAAVDEILIEGNFVRLYGEKGPQYAIIIGRDLTKRTLAREAAAAAATTVASAKPRSEKQVASDRAWGERMRAAREAKKLAALAA